MLNLFFFNFIPIYLERLVIFIEAWLNFRIFAFSHKFLISWDF